MVDIKKLIAMGVLGKAGEPPLLEFSDDFERADGDLSNGWSYTAGKWTIASGRAVGTPGLGASNLFVNPNFDDGTGWTINEGDWSIGGGVATKVPGTGTKKFGQSVSVGHKWYRMNWDLVVRAGTFYATLGNSISNITNRGTSGSYIDIMRSVATQSGVNGAGAGDGDIDNMDLRLITLADQFCVRDLTGYSIDASAPITLLSSTAAGIVICLDSITTPANFIIAHHDGTYAYLLKCVGGVYTQLIRTAAAYADDRILRVVKTGTTVKLFYHGVQIGADQTISDAGVIKNTKHGLFTTYGGNSFGELICINPT